VHLNSAELSRAHDRSRTSRTLKSSVSDALALTYHLEKYRIAYPTTSHPSRLIEKEEDGDKGDQSRIIRATVRSQLTYIRFDLYSRQTQQSPYRSSEPQSQCQHFSHCLSTVILDLALHTHTLSSLYTISLHPPSTSKPSPPPRSFVLSSIYARLVTL
jgi:hypothetical protein